MRQAAAADQRLLGRFDVVDLRRHFRERAIAELAAQITSREQFDQIVNDAQPALRPHVRALLAQYVTFETTDDDAVEVLVNPVPRACCGRTPFFCECTPAEPIVGSAALVPSESRDVEARGGGLVEVVE